MHEATYQRLIEIARAKGVITYSEIAPLAGLDMVSPADRNEIGRILGEISTYEHEQGRPLLSAVVVHKDRGMPGPGFFTLAKDLGVYQGDDDLEFHVSQLRRVYRHWGQST